ncbi:endo-1,4-beta-xylanase xylA, putative (macronuclear) [Tetrahymena thermophila SB210]|uniref:Endo-1,4-beta-xylanase xylA, putative n=1 Tax=Tetrahymena thermophila (strain SB210) TaxID=312017 RepID=I7LVA7_TETTS|nr:endo-1,4-beta-xylanase xylA, putative [Tetrahymena thermophila SB210]EAR97564.2 endo-1,4-beta-xylanase xylA, putative [Tetrahymena thermophila SB210]|eukprot:XP_001017809.2 endo-1,4-beta-xylanase xylA, putative [Tetrahymena thermophila SB210]
MICYVRVVKILKTQSINIAVFQLKIGKSNKLVKVISQPCQSSLFIIVIILFGLWLWQLSSQNKLLIKLENVSDNQKLVKVIIKKSIKQSREEQKKQQVIIKNIRNNYKNKNQEILIELINQFKQLENFTYLLSEGMDKPKDTLGLLQDEHQKENINSNYKFGNRSGFMSQQDNPRSILSQSSVNAPNILQPNQQSQNQYKSNTQARENIYRQSIDLKNSQVLPQLKDRAISQKERKSASQEKESQLKQHQVRNIMINKDLNQFQNEQRRQSSIQQMQAKHMESGQQFNNNNLQTPRSREENSATTKDSLVNYLSSQKKLQKIQTSPSDKAVNQLNSQFQSLNDFKDNIEEGRNQTQIFNQSNKKLSQPNSFNIKKDLINEDKFVNIDVSLNTLTQQQKTKNIYSRAQTAQENQFTDKGIKRDSQTIDVESLETAPNINVGLIQDQKLILNHLKKQNQNSNQTEKPLQHNQNQNKDYDGANITFYPKQSSKKNVNKISTNDQNEIQQEAQYQMQQQLIKKKSSSDNNNESQNDAKIRLNDCVGQYNISQSNQKNTITSQKVEDISRRASCQNQQINLKNPQSQYQQKNQMIYTNQVEVYQQQTEPNAIQTQPDFSFSNQYNNSKQYILSEGQQFEQIEQIPKNQMKFHNLYQKNISHSKNNSLSQGLPNTGVNNLGTGIHFLEQSSNNQQSQKNYNRQNQLKNSQLSQQRASNYVGQIKRQLNQQCQQQIDVPYPIPQGHHRSNSHHLDTRIAKPNSFLMTNQFEGQFKDCLQKELKSIKGNNDRCNLSFDQRNDDFISNQYYSDNKQRNLSTNQNDLLVLKQKGKRNESLDILETSTQNNGVNNADRFRFTQIKNNQNSKNIASIQCTTALKSDKQMLNQQINQIQQTFAASLTQNNNQLSSINQVKKLSDICLPSLDQQNKSRNESLNNNQSKKITLSSLKIQPNSQLNQNSQPIQLCIDKFTFNTQKNVIKPSNKNYQNQNLNFTENKAGQFGYTLNANQIRQTILENNIQQNEPSSQILKKSLLSKNNETNAQEKPSNNESDQADQANNQILEETGRFGQEQITENQKKNNQKQLMISLNDNINNINVCTQLKYQKNDLMSQFPNKNNNQRPLRNSLEGVQIDQNQQKQINNIQLYNNSGLLSTDGPDMLSSQNPNSIINIPVITTNFGLNNSQGITKPNADTLNQGTLLIHYNFPLAEVMQYRSKYQKHQQKQISDIQNNYINYAQKKVSSAISCKRNEDFYSQFDGTGNDILDKQQRARSSNNRFPREIFTPNVQKAKRLNSQNKQNLNFNNCINNQEQQNEFIQQ